MSFVQVNKIKERLLPLSPIVQGKLEQELTSQDFELQKNGGRNGALGQGAFGKVFLVKNKQTSKIYALKQISKTQIKEQNMISQITNEIILMYGIDHPNIIQLFNHFEENEFIYLVLEYAGGGQMWQKLNNVGRFDEQRVKEFMRDIINAVEYLHSKKPPIIHRDIKPENLIFDNNGRVKLADFGWSNVLNENKLRQTYCGTLDYLAPEMIQESGHDVQLDIWSLGVLIYELLTGRAPFAPTDKTLDQKQKQQILQQNILNVNIEYPNDFPILCKDLITHLLQKDPQKRITITQMKQHPWFTIGNKIEFYTLPSKKPTINLQIINSEGAFSNDQIAQVMNRISNHDNENEEKVEKDVEKIQMEDEQEIQEAESGPGGDTNTTKLNQKISELLQELSQCKISLEMQKHKNLDLQNLVDKQDPSQITNSTQTRKFKLLEEEVVRLKAESNNLWEKLNERDQYLRVKETELDQTKDYKRQIEKLKTDKQQQLDTINNLRDQLDNTQNELSNTLSEKEQQIFKMEIKIKELQFNNSDSMIPSGSIGLNELQQAIQELKQGFQIYQETYDNIQELSTRNRELERDLLRLKLEKDSEISEIKMQVIEQKDDEIDSVKLEMKNKIEYNNNLQQTKIQQLEETIERLQTQNIQADNKESEYKSLKTQLEISVSTVNDMKQEWQNGKRLRQILENKLKDQEYKIMDYEQLIQKLEKNNKK